MSRTDNTMPYSIQVADRYPQLVGFGGTLDELSEYVRDRESSLPAHAIGGSRHPSLGKVCRRLRRDDRHEAALACREARFYRDPEDVDIHTEGYRRSANYWLD